MSPAPGHTARDAWSSASHEALLTYSQITPLPRLVLMRVVTWSPPHSKHRTSRVSEVQTSSYEVSQSRDVMSGRVAVVYYRASHVRKLLRVDFKRLLPSQEKIIICN